MHTFTTLLRANTPQSTCQPVLVAPACRIHAALHTLTHLEKFEDAVDDVENRAKDIETMFCHITYYK